MKVILHISNDYTGSTVYKNLIGKLDYLEIPQIVYTPVKSAASIGRNEIKLKTEGARIIYSHILNKTLDRIFYKLKVKKILSDVESKVDFSKIDLIHAHTWYSDGGVAYLLHQKYKIPYIVTIRNTDINVFQKFLVHERDFGRQILQFARSIILISASYKERVLNLPSLGKIKDEIENKIKVLPNGVDPFWIKHAVETRTKKELTDVVSILFIGKLTKGKNIDKLQEAIWLLNKEGGKKVVLHIVGGGGEIKQQVLQQVRDNPSIFIYHGEIYEKEELQRILRSCDIFAMPSSRETFGLVYVEAMLQGLPILYTENEGIDGFYSERIGEKVHRRAEIHEIKEKLKIMIENDKNYSIPLDDIKQNHDWSLIAKEYQVLYGI